MSLNLVRGPVFREGWLGITFLRPTTGQRVWGGSGREEMRPLQGIRVLSLETWGSGSFHGELLAMLGAEVINIEDPRQGGNPLRTMGALYLDRNHQDNEGNAFCLHNKKSLLLDLREEDGKKVFYRLVKTAHAVIDNFRGNKAESLGITHQDLKAHNPQIVCTHLSGYGRDNERKTWPGYDFLMQAETGWMSVTGDPGSPPTKVGVSVVDLLGSVYGALCTVSALLRAQRSSQGCDAETNLFDVALNCLCYQGMYYLNEGLVGGKQPRSAHATQCPSQIYRTADGWVYIACLTQKFWELLCQKLNRQDLAADPRFETNNRRMEHRDELTEILDGVLMQHPTAFWTETSAAAYLTPRCWILAMPWKTRLSPKTASWSKSPMTATPSGTR